MNKSILSIFLFFASVFCAADAIAQGCPSPSSATASVTFKRRIPGAIAGDFSVASGKKIAFAQGNLQYNSDTQTWQFAEHQYDYIGNTTGNTSITADGKANNTGVADLFGWVGASSSWTGLKQYGLTSSKTTNAVDGYGNVASESLKSSWGSLMGSGWRLLSTDEWNYLFGNRGGRASTMNGGGYVSYVKATVNAVPGLIIFPDGEAFASSEFTTLNLSGQFSETTCTSEQWVALEAKGCVFLPLAGSRSGNTVENVGVRGNYWINRQAADATIVYGLTIYDGGTATADTRNRATGSSVRLVKDVE